MIKDDDIPRYYYFRMYAHSLINKLLRLFFISNNPYSVADNLYLSTYESISKEIIDAKTQLSRKYHLHIPLKKWQITPSSMSFLIF